MSAAGKTEQLPENRQMPAPIVSIADNPAVNCLR